MHIFTCKFRKNNYIYILSSTDRSVSFSVGKRARFPRLVSKPGWLKRQSKILPLSLEKASAGEVNLNGYESQLLLFTYFRLTATENSIHMKSLAYTLMATQLLYSLESSTLGEHIYIVIHRETCFVLSLSLSIYIYIYIYITFQLDRYLWIWQSHNQTVLFLTIEFRICHLFVQTLNLKTIFLTHRKVIPHWSKGNWEQWQWRRTPQPQSSSITGGPP